MTGGEYGKIYKRIWGDKDFKALPGSQQLLYVKLLSQPDISMAGVLTLASTRWAGQTADATHEEAQNAMEMPWANWHGCTQAVPIRPHRVHRSPASIPPCPSGGSNE